MSFAATLKLGKAKPRVQRNSPPQLASKGWSLKAAAAQIGCDFSHLSRVISGERAMTRDMKSRIAELPNLANPRPNKQNRQP